MASSGIRWLDSLRTKLRSLTRRERTENEMDDELRFHFENVVDGYVRQGLTPDTARRRAQLEIGGVDQIKEECRDARGLALIENLARDIGYAWRGLWREKAFTLAATVAIALGVGANTALFTLLYGLVLRPLPVKDPATIRNIYMETQGSGNRNFYNGFHLVSFPEFNFMRDHATTAELAAVAEQEVSWKGARGRPLYAQLVSANLLPLIGGQPAVGRFFSPAETSHPGSAPVAVLSYVAWQNYFGGALDVVGRTMVFNRTLFTVIGVADRSTTGPLIVRPDLWIPYTMQAVIRPSEALIQDIDTGWLQVIGRRKPGASEAAMHAEMQVLGQQALAAHNSKLTAQVTVAPGAFLNRPNMMRQGALAGGVLLLAVSLVLLVACSNVANMMLARGLNRRREIAVRLSIGAGKGRILQQLLTESLLLATLGGALGLLLAQAGTRLVMAGLPADIGPHQLHLSPNWHILLYTLTISLCAGMVFGFFPALNLLRSNLTPALKSTGLETESQNKRFRLQNALIAVQVAACLVLLINAGLLLRGFRTALHADPGQAVRNVLIVSMDLRQQQYNGEQAERLLTSLRESAATLPGVVGASITPTNPFLSQCVTEVNTVLPGGSLGQPLRVSCDQAGLDFFRTMHIPLLQGRDFTRADLKSHAKVIVIDERIARHAFPGSNPLGRRIRWGQKPEDDREIIGVVAARTGLGIDATDIPFVYEPLDANRAPEGVLVVGYHGPREPLGRVIEKLVANLDSNVTATVKPIEENVNMALIPNKIAVAAASTLGGLGLLLACTGVYC